MEKDKILIYLEQHMDDLLQMLKEVVELESPDHENKITSDKCSRYLCSMFAKLGFDMETIPQSTCGDHLYGELGNGEKSAIIVGHYDTVFPIGTLEKMPFKIEGNKAYGPGILDMKGGLVMAYFAIKAIQDLNMMPDNKTIGIFMNSDEESGSFCSSDLIIEKAKKYKCAFVMEPGVDGIGSVKMKRFGRGTYTVKAIGKEAHSGSNPNLAVSPIMEIAHQLLGIAEWDRNEEDATLAPTVIRGGIDGTCVIPREASFTMDVRYKTEKTAARVHREIMELAAIDKRCRIAVKGKIDKPVMVGDEELYQRFERLAQEYDVELDRITVGGGSDGNFTAAAGIPTLDGLGMSGEFLHNVKEYVHIDHIPVRTAMFARLLRSI